MLDNLQLLFVWAPIINLQVILDGIFVGAVFALSAYGLALVWGVMNIKNLAQGDFVIMGGYLALSLHYLGIPLPLILIIVVALMFVFGWGHLYSYNSQNYRSRYVCFSASNFRSIITSSTGA